jgi:hypothetical protein
VGKWYTYDKRSTNPRQQVVIPKIFIVGPSISRSIVLIVASANGTTENLSVQTTPVFDRKEWNVFIGIRVFRIVQVFMTVSV